MKKKETASCAKHAALPHGWLAVVLPFTVGTASALPPFPSLTQPVREEIAAVKKELETLPLTPLSISPWTHGFSSRQHETPEQPVRIDITFARPETVDLIAIMPATYTAGDDVVRAFGFPVRFSIERLLPDGSVTMLANHLDSDYPTPGLDPQLFDCDHPVPTAGLRITVTDLPFNPTWWRATRAVALSEVFAFSGEKNVALQAKVSASNSFDFSYIWSPDCLTDGFFPFSPIDFELTDPENSFSVKLDEVVLGFDLGQPRRIDEFRLWPVVHSIQHHFPNASGVGFPTRFRVESATSEDFKDATVIHESKSIRIRPGSDPLMLPTSPVEGRYLRLTLADGYPDFRIPDPKRITLSEVEFLENGRVVSTNVVPKFYNLSQWPLGWENLTEGDSNVGRIMPLREWVVKFQRRKQLERNLATLRLDLEAAQRREEKRNGWILLIAAILIVLLVQMIWMVRARAKRRWERVREQIGCDLHDELGANVSSIAHIAELLGETIESPTATQTRLLKNLLENARLTTREARQLVRLIEDDDSSRGLNVQLREVAEQILGATPADFDLSDARLFRRLDPLTRWNLVLFYKEALNNVIRHADASRVRVTTHSEGSDIILHVEDNGRGLDTNSPLPRHLKNRAEILGGSLTITSEPAQGTRVTLRFRKRSE